jgi:hypothetical protein
LNHHRKSVHTVFTAAIVYACNLCEAKSKSSEGLRMHIKRAHTEVKQSNSHKQVRAKNKPNFICQVCNKQLKSAVKMICIFFLVGSKMFDFLSQSGLHHHRNAVHTVFTTTAEKVYACNLCEAKSKSSEGLRLHMKRTHNKIKESTDEKRLDSGRLIQ